MKNALQNFKQLSLVKFDGDVVVMYLDGFQAKTTHTRKELSAASGDQDSQRAGNRFRSVAIGPSDGYSDAILASIWHHRPGVQRLQPAKRNRSRVESLGDATRTF
jgi:hypothetical protein